MNSTNQQQLLEQVFQHARQIGELEKQYRLEGLKAPEQEAAPSTGETDSQRQTPAMPIFVEELLEQSSATSKIAWQDPPAEEAEDPGEETLAQKKPPIIKDLPEYQAPQLPPPPEKVTDYIKTLEEEEADKDEQALAPEPTPIVEPSPADAPPDVPYEDLVKPYSQQKTGVYTQTAAYQKSPPTAPAVLGQDDFLSEGSAQTDLHSQETSSSLSPLEKFIAMFRSEEKFGTTWLLWIGGILLLIGAAIGASQIQSYISPTMRLVAGYGLSAVLAAAGWLVRKRNEVVQRGAVAIGLSLSYFLSFASHYIEYTKVFENPVLPLLLMAGFAGAIVVLAERWRSELVAGFGMALGVMAALISAPASANFALIALGILALGAGVLLVRNEWTRLTAVALIGTYLSSVGLWFIVGTEGMVAGATTHLAALFIYHGIFSVAFWRWGRVWMARERLMETADETEALPRVESGMLPYSRGFVIINSIGLISLSLLLLYVTKVHWAHVDTLLFTLAGLEIGRLIIPAFRREGLASFHFVVGMGLVCAAIVAVFNGMAESAVLAVQVLALVVAASRAKGLRWIRPLTLIPAMLTFRSFVTITPVNLAEYIGLMMTPAMLYAATLPWECIMVRKPKPLGGLALRTLDYLSGTMRALTATVLVMIGTEKFMTTSIEGSITFAAVMIVLLVGLLLLNATTWILPALALGFASLLLIIIEQGFNGNIDSLPVYLIIGMFLLAIYLWEESGKRPLGKVRRITRPFIGTLGAIVWTLMIITILLPTVPSMGIALLILTMLLGGIYYITKNSATFPMLISLPDDESTWEERRTLQWKLLSLPFVAMISCALIGIFMTLTRDAQTSLLAPLVYSAVGFALWLLMILRKKSRTPITEVAALVISLNVLTAGTLVSYGISLNHLYIPMTPILTSFVISWKRERKESLAISALLLSALAVIMIVCCLTTSLSNLLGVLTGLALVGVMVIGTRALRQITADEETTDGWKLVLTSCYETWVPVVSILALMLLLAPALFGGMFTTVFWGLYSIALLAAGFIFLDKMMRYTSFAAFAAAVLRVFFVDLAGSNAPTKVVAFIGLGLLFIVSGVAYGFLSKRLLKKESE
jgi:predicted membrane protein DUF2339